MHLLSPWKSEMNQTMPSFFNIMKDGAAHLLALIHFNTHNSQFDKSFQLYSTQFEFSKVIDP